MSVYLMVTECIECGSEDIFEIDRFFDDEEEQYVQRIVCNHCGNDWHEPIED